MRLTVYATNMFFVSALFGLMADDPLNLVLSLLSGLLTLACLRVERLAAMAAPVEAERL